MTDHRILITGATGNIGRRLVRRLLDAGADVLAGSPGGEGVEGAPGRRVDFNDVAMLEAAMSDVDTLFLLLPLVPSKLTLARRALAAARAAGVRHVLRSSGAGADALSPVAIAKLQGEVDQLVIDSGMAWTLVRPNSFMQSFISAYGAMIRGGVVRLSLGEGRCSYFDVEDIAAVDAAILLDPAAHGGNIYTVTGPEALTFGEAVSVIARHTARPVALVDISEGEAVHAMRGRGMDGWTIDILSSLNRVIAEGHAAAVSSDVQRITGQAPRQFEAFVLRNAAAWA